MSQTKNKNSGKQMRRRAPRRNNQRSVIPNQLYALSFPRETKVSLRYVENIVITTGAAVSNDYLFNLNSIFDPNRTGTGHQPQGHDQWALFYGRYRVDSCHVDIISTTNSTHGALVSIFGSNIATALTDPLAFLETPLLASSHTNLGAPPARVRKTFNLPVVNGVTREVYNADDRFMSPFGSSPSETLILHMSCVELSFGAGVTIDNIVSITYDVTLSDPVQLAQS